MSRGRRAYALGGLALAQEMPAEAGISFLLTRAQLWGCAFGDPGVRHSDF